MKPILRKMLRAQRRTLGRQDHRSLSTRAARAILQLPAFSYGKRIALYLPFDGETATALLVRAARRRGARVYVPVVHSRRHAQMRFHPLTLKTRRGAYGIAVPVAHGRSIAPRWLDLVVIPCVGIARDGRRLGMGRGFYDRALAYRQSRRHWRGPRLVGIAFDCQQVESIDAQRWDLRLDFVATESGLKKFL